MRRTVSSLILAIALLNQFGCASVMHGATQQIGIFSAPTGAQVKIDGVPHGDTPLHANLKRKTEHVVSISMEGYEPYEALIKKRLAGWTWGNILLGGGIGLIIDLITGSTGELYPENIHAELKPAS